MTHEEAIKNINALNAVCCEKDFYDAEFENALALAIDAIKKQATADAVPVVRCRDCAVPHNKYTGCPELNGLVTPPDFYCPFGERKDGKYK